MLDSNYSELLEDGKLKLYLRDGIFYARVLIPGTRTYKHRSLRTSKLESARFQTQKRGADGFTANTLAQHFHHLYKGAGIEGASSHSGRRSFITNLAAQGVGVRVLMSLAGHRNISTTQHYIDCNDDMKRRAVELI